MELKPKKIISRWTNNKSFIIWKYIDNNTWNIIRITWVGFHIGASELNASFLLVKSFNLKQSVIEWSRRLKTHIKNIKWKTLLEIRESFNFGNFILWEWFENFRPIFKISANTTFGYIDVGDGCWRRNVLMTTIRCWLTIFLASGTIIQKRSSKSTNRHQHYDVTNIARRFESKQNFICYPSCFNIRHMFCSTWSYGNYKGILVAHLISLTHTNYLFLWLILITHENYSSGIYSALFFHSWLGSSSYELYLQGMWL